MLNFSLFNNLNISIRDRALLVLKKKRLYFLFIGLLSITLFYRKEIHTFFYDKKGIKYNLQNSLSIENKLDEIRERWSADRVAINIFEENNREFFRSYEAVADGVFVLKSKIAKYPVAPFEKSFFNLRQNGYIYIEDVDTYELDTFLSKVVKSMGVKSVLYVAIYSPYKTEIDGLQKVDAFMTYEYESKLSKLSKRDISNMIKEKKLVESILRK